ncbi:unnamed protein product [Euphydryas editha]|uniref:Uncharacterized protein n=1 Tax=Euphydryas editha TaxID=104508 RepID=A0AAU9TRD7_EUPED|nr:unnamed protein product [Euphydryas editha]
MSFIRRTGYKSKINRLLYSSSAHTSKTQDIEDRRAPLLRHFSEDIPDIEVGEISATRKEAKNERASGGDGNTMKLLKVAARPVLKP